MSERYFIKNTNEEIEILDWQCNGDNLIAYACYVDTGETLYVSQYLVEKRKS